MRTNVEIDDDTLAIVMQRYRLATKTEAVNLALRRLAGRPMTREEALAPCEVRRRSTRCRLTCRFNRDPGRYVGVGEVRPCDGQPG